MSDLSRMLNIAKSGLNASRYAMDVTSTNIANASSEGYSRQKVVMEAAQSVETPYGYLSTGVEIKTVQRIRDNFVDQEIRDSNSQQAYSETMNELLDQVEAYFNEPIDNGLSVELDSFFTSFEELANNVEDSGVRETVIQQGVSMSKVFNSVATGLDTVRFSTLASVDNAVKKINDLTKEIASLNQQIFSVGDVSVNELQDTRDNSIDELSKLIDVKVIIDDNGLANISASGSTLVSGVNSLSIVADSNSDYIQLLYSGTNTALADVSGKVGAYIDAFNSTISKYSDKLDTLASTLITEVNKLHSAGYGITNETTGETSTGVNFFTGTDARTIAVTDEVKNDVNKIAAGATATEGDNTVAYDIAKILDKGFFDGGNTSISQYYRSIVTTLGYENSDTLRSAEALAERVSSLESIKSSVSGVSLDDEMVNIIKYQRSFEAASKIVQTVDEMFDVLFNMV